MTQQVDTVIVGGGQGGLSTSYCLKQQGREHVILEQAPQAASAWRERWDSFTLITPNWAIKLPGAEYRGNDPDAFMPRNEVIQYFTEYIERFDLPVKYGIRVTAVEATQTGYVVTTNGAQYHAANVIIAAGMYHEPKIPSFSANLLPEIRQLHSSAYRNPEALPEGAVLVIGSAQSGCQIAEELHQSGRKVFLSVGGAARFPRRYRGKDMVWWWWSEEMGFRNITVDQLPSPQAKFAGNAHGTGKDGGHTINLHQFVKDGIVLLGHIQDIQQEKIVLTPDLKASLAKADKAEADFVKQVDENIKRTGYDAPLETLPQLTNGFQADEILELNLKTENITSIIWATGYSFDFAFVKLPIFDSDGYPVQKRGVTAYPGLYFVGLPFLHNIKSGLLVGVGEDAAYVVEHMTLAVT